MAAIATQLESIVGVDHVYPWEQVEASRQTLIQQAITSDTPPACMVYPKNQDELAEVMACAAQNHWRVLPCGNGDKLHWGGLTHGIDLVVSTAEMNRLVRHAVGDLTCTAEAGLKFSDLQTILSQQRQFLALDPAYPDAATLGGIVATASAGSWRQRYGGVRDMLIGVSFVRFDGQVAKAGGQVVKNVAGYDLMKLMTGSYGTLAVLSQLTFRTYPLQEAARTVVQIGQAADIANVTLKLRASVLTPVAIDLFSPSLMAALNYGEDFGLAARFQGIPTGVEEQAKRLMEMGSEMGLSGRQLESQADADFWRQANQLLWPPDAIEGSVICKLGVPPTGAVGLLQAIAQFTQPKSIVWQARIHASSGLGILRFTPEEMPADLLLKVRSHCESEGGFLTLLQAPKGLKRQVDVWGVLPAILYLLCVASNASSTLKVYSALDDLWPACESPPSSPSPNPLPPSPYPISSAFTKIYSTSARIAITLMFPKGWAYMSLTVGC